MLGCHLKPEPKHHNFHLIRPITTADMDSINIALKHLGDFGNCCSLYEICEKNCQSILGYYGAIKDGLLFNRGREFEYVEETLQEMNRLLLNYLSSFRTFTDHLETRYKKLQRQGYSYLADYKKITAACYDGNFPYRFFNKLRNYIQHCGLPLHFMNIKEDVDQNGSVITSISICLKRDDLISDYDGWVKVKSDLRSQPEYMELLPYLTGLRSQIRLINLVISGFEIALATDSWHFIYGLVHEVMDKYPNGRPFIGRYVEPEKGKPELQTIDFPLHIMVKFQEKLLEIKDFQIKQKMKRKSAAA
jgi:hypothetical protein